MPKPATPAAAWLFAGPALAACLAYLAASWMLALPGAGVLASPPWFHADGVGAALLLALAPAALAWVPGVRVARPLAQGTNPGPAASPPVPVDSVAAGAAG
ncbi:MAG: hypothetical protein FDZ70_02600 [Actinobacteria bacterium]|nr:MAG: hypothetical protein FDZ70_02600 [Actinomycetota bacterium]